MCDSLRRTGRTSRTIERALCGMLLGKQVLLVMANREGVKHAMAYGTEWLHRNGFIDNGQVPLTVEKFNAVFRFGTGSLRVLPLEANMRGLRVELTLQDHYADELLAERRRAEARAAAREQIIALMREHGFVDAYKLNVKGDGNTTIEFT